MRKRHREIRMDIKRVADVLMWRYRYDRTLVRFQETGASAFVYHPYATDASLHRPTLRTRALVRTNGHKQIAAAVSQPPAAEQNQPKVFCVPVSLARLVGASPEGKPGITLNILSSLFIIVKPPTST